MRRIKNILILAIGLMSATSCSESFFDLLPTDELNVDSYFKNAKEVETMLNDAYFSMRKANESIYLIGDVASDNAYNHKFNNAWDNISMNEATVTSSSGILSTIFTESYKVINRANITIMKCESVAFDAALKAQYAGEAKFLRAATYFNLVRVFGGVPLVLIDIQDYNELYTYGRASVDEIYAQIEKDLKDAYSLPESYTVNNQIGRVTSIAAKSMMGKVYLTLKKYGDAKTVLGEVVGKEGAKLGLLNSYASVFDPDNANNKEIIFAVQYARGFDPGMGNPLMSSAYPNQEVVTGPGWGALKRGGGTFLMTNDLFAQFAAGDTRLEMLYDKFTDPAYTAGNTYNFIVTMKYYDKANNAVGKADSGCDWIMLRYADVLLMYAEALNETGDTGGALTQLTKVRTRAGLTTENIASKDAMKLALEKERRVELNMEGHRWFDLLRTDRLIEVMNAHFKSGAAIAHDYLRNCQVGDGTSVMTVEKTIFPLPKFETDLNPDKLK